MGSAAQVMGKECVRVGLQQAGCRHAQPAGNGQLAVACHLQQSPSAQRQVVFLQV